MFEILENLDDDNSIDNNINEKWENIKNSQGNQTAAYTKG